MNRFIKYIIGSSLPKIGNPLTPNYEAVQMGSSDSHFYACINEGINFILGNPGFEEVDVEEVVSEVKAKFIPENHFNVLVGRNY